MQKKVVKVVIFTIIFALCFNMLSKVLTSPNDYRNYQWIGGFYEEEDNSLDAVYIGSSNCYATWNPVLAWEEYGIAVYPYCCNAQPLFAVEYLIKEARKTQPDATFIVNINTVSDRKIAESEMHYLLDYMPFSLNKLKLTQYLSKVSGYTFEESLEFYLPIIRYHTRYGELTSEDFSYKIDGLKGASHYDTYLNLSKNVSDLKTSSDEEAVLSEDLVDCIHSLLDYIEK